ncbi:ATP-dependent RNA helicase, partial [Lachnellula willkommii]
MAIKRPTGIQKGCIPEILKGRDCIGGSRTGSGKTVAFAVPILQKWAEDPELALQIYEQFKAISSPQSLKAVLITGGSDMRPQATALAQRPHLVIATPGRLADHIRTSGEDTICALRRVKMVVLDEADRLLASGGVGSMLPDVEECLSIVPPPAKRQTLLFTATMTPEVRALKELPRAPGKPPVFVCEVDLQALAIPASLNQIQRTDNLGRFRASAARILVATDVAARGLDIPEVDLVINYDISRDPDDYIHRVGRTARAGRKGKSVTFVGQRDVQLVQAIEARVGRQMEAWEEEGVNLETRVIREALKLVGEKKREALLEIEEGREVGGKRKRVGNVITSLFTAVYRGKDRKPSGGLYKYVMLTAVRTMTRRASARQQHYISAPTDDNYIIACKKRGVQPNSITLEDGTRANWIGDPTAEKVLINFHGGGYTFPAAPEMFEFMFQIISVLQSQGKNIACLFLSYDLAPARVYPRQLQQGAMLLNHVLHTLHIPPSNILLTGDSAGGNLAVGLLAHISHPHPGLHGVDVPKVELGEGGNAKLKGVVLISPWVSFNLDSESWIRNEYKDCLCKKAGQQWSSAFLDHPQPLDPVSDYYNQAITAPESWWEGAAVEKVLIVA